jgi:large conductance mechanosensitive channel
VSGFKEFLLKTNALALAVGVIIGVALGGVVNSLVTDIIMPPVGVLLGGIDFAQLRFVLKDNVDPTKVAAINYGLFLNSIISFIVIAAVVYWVSKMFIKEEVAAPAKTCPFCKESNAVDATKCRACTSAI